MFKIVLHPHVDRLATRGVVVESFSSIVMALSTELPVHGNLAPSQSHSYSSAWWQ